MPPHVLLHLTPGPHFSASVTALVQAPNRYFTAIASAGVQLRVTGASDYCISKQALNRRVIFIALGGLGP